MADNEKFEFCSEQWVGVADDFLRNASRGIDLGDIRFSVSEIMTDAPSHLAHDEKGRAGWYYQIRDGSVSAKAGLLEEADVLITVDYQSILPLSRIVFADNPDGVAEAKKTTTKLAAEGKLKYETSGREAPSIPWADALHDVLARQTR